MSAVIFIVFVILDILLPCRGPTPARIFACEASTILTQLHNVIIDGTLLNPNSPVHLFAGMWGLVAPALFASSTNMKNAYGAKEGYYGIFLGGKNGFKMLACQITALVVILAWTFTWMIPFFMILSRMGIFRVSEEQEEDGLGKIF